MGVSNGTPRMEQLPEYRCAMLPATSGQLFQSRNNGVTTRVQVSRFELEAWVKSHALENDQAHAASCASLVVGDQVIRNDTFGSQRRAVWRIENPVRYPRWS